MVRMLKVGIKKYIQIWIF